MEKERVSIISEINLFDIEWVAGREDACQTALYMYSKISGKFNADSKYGPEFVAKNQQLIGMLVQAAMNEFHAKTLSESSTKNKD
jgi:hypothetical protein